MTYKTLLADAGPSEGAERRLGIAADLAERFDAAILGVGAEAPDPWLVAVAVDVTEDVARSIQMEAAARVSAAEAAFHRALLASRQPREWRSALVEPAEAIAEASACADLILVGQPGEHGVDPVRQARPGDVIMAAGAPVLVVPPGRDRLRAESVVVGWKNTRETRRAITDALPFLVAAKEVLLIAAHPPSGARAVAQEMEDAASRLARHGVRVLVKAPIDDPDPAALLLAAAEAERADLVVAGAYGHSRAREWIFGGVTQSLLRDARCFVLFSR